MMKRSVRDRAVLALRTTAVPQLRLDLTDGNGRFCALGVIALEFGWDGILAKAEGFYDLVGPIFESEPHYGAGRNFSEAISARNDNGWTFDQIAQWIEDNVPVEEDEVIEIAEKELVLT